MILRVVLLQVLNEFFSLLFGRRVKDHLRDARRLEARDLAHFELAHVLLVDAFALDHGDTILDVTAITIGSLRNTVRWLELALFIGHEGRAGPMVEGPVAVEHEALLNKVERGESEDMRGLRQIQVNEIVGIFDELFSLVVLKALVPYSSVAGLRHEAHHLVHLERLR